MIETCYECGHALSYHTETGCEYEQADSFTSGYAQQAPGPCGCLHLFRECFQCRKKYYADDLHICADIQEGIYRIRTIRRVKHQTHRNNGGK